MSRQTLTTSQDYSSVTGLVLMVGGTVATVVPIQLLLGWNGPDRNGSVRWHGGLEVLAEIFAYFIPAAKYLGAATYLINGMLIIAGSAATIHRIQKKIQEKLAERSRLVSRELNTFNVLNSEQSDNRAESRCKVCCPPTPLKTFIWGMAGLTLLTGVVATGISLSKGGEWLEENLINPLPLLRDILLAGFIEIEMGLLFGLGKGLHKLIPYVYNDYTADKLPDLMESLDLTESALVTAGIDKQALSVAAHPSLHGKVLRFFTTTSLSRALLRWPFMWRGLIGVDSSHSNQPSSESMEIQTEGEGLISLLDETSSGDPEQALFFSESEETNTDKQLALPSPTRVSGCCFPVFSTSGILIRSPGIMRTVVSLNAFHDTAEMVLDGVWSALLSSLIIHNVVNYSLYPNEFNTENTRLWNILGIANTFTLLCAGENRYRYGTRLYEYCNGRTVGYEETLAAVLSEPFVWPVLLGIPLMFGFIDALSKARNTGRLDKQRIGEQISVLRQYQPGFWTDVMGWVVSAAVPDILAAFIPPAILFLLLPQPKIKRALETIRTHIIWDGQLTATQRIRLFNALLSFSQTRTQFTQMKALTMLADITDNIDFSHLKTLRQQGVDQQHLITLIKIKTQALQELCLLAKHYHLPDEPTHYFRPLPRFLYANYLAWRLGRSQHLYLQPLYFAYGGVKLYFKLIFYQTLVLGIIHLVNFYNTKRDCEREGGFYQLLKYPSNDEDYSCVCGGVIAPHAADCPETYFSLPRALEDSLSFLDRIDRKTWYSNVDLSQQTPIIQDRALPKLLDLINFKFHIAWISIRNQQLDRLDIAALADLIQNQRGFRSIDLSGCKLPNGGVSILLKAWLKVHAISDLRLDFSGILLTNLTEVKLLADLLMKDEYGIHALILDSTNLGDSGIEVLKNGFSSNITKLSMKHCNITSQGCVALVNTLLEKGIYIEEVDLSNNPIDSACAIALLKGLRQDSYSSEVYLSGKNKIGDLDIIVIANAFRSSSIQNLRILKIAGRDVKPDSLIQLIHALPSSDRDLAFHYTHYHEKGPLNYATFLPKLVHALNQSDIRRFGWHSPSGDGLGPNEAAILSDYIRRGWLRNILFFDFNDNHIGSGIVSLITATAFQDQDKGILLRRNNISAIDVQALANTLNHSKIYGLDISSNHIGDAGSLALLEMYFFYLPPFAEVEMTGRGLQGLSDYLHKQERTTHPLWIDMLRFRAKERHYIKALWLYEHPFTLQGNHFKKQDLEAFCKVWIMTGEKPTDLGLTLTNENVSFIDHCLISSAGSNKIEHWVFWPLFRHIGLLKRAATGYLRHAYLLLSEYTYQPDPTAPQKKSTTTLTTQHPTHPQKKPIPLLTLDLRGINSNQVIFLDLRKWHHPVDRLIAGHHNNHLLISNENTLLDLNHNHGKNLLVPGINNTIRLSGKNKNHIIITPNLGTLTIHHFTPSDHLHMIDQHTLFTNTNTTTCQQRHSTSQLPTAIISLNNTQLHFINTPCKTILPRISYNNETAIRQAQSEVLQAPANQNSFHYFPLLDIAKTFLYSFGQSALFTALPFFMAELCYQAQLFSWAQAYAFASKLQSEVLLATHLSSNPFIASILARAIVARLTGSKQLSSMAGIGASIVTGIIEHLLTENASMPWILLQISVATMGAAVGSVAIQTLPQLTVWGWCKAKKVSSDVGNCIRHGVGFWSRDPISESAAYPRSPQLI